MTRRLAGRMGVIHTDKFCDYNTEVTFAVSFLLFLLSMGGRVIEVNSGRHTTQP